MDFNLTPEQQALADSVERFCRKDYAFQARRAAVETPEGFSRETWARFADLGWLGAGLSEALGGFGGGAIENALIMEGFGRALVVEPFLSAAVLAPQTLAALPPSGPRDDLLRQAVGDEALLALAHGEPAARGDIDRITTRAERTCGQWRVSGHKSLVLGAATAHQLMVSAAADDGVGLFLISPQAANLRLQPYRMLDDVRVADIWLDDTPVEATLAAPGAAMAAIETGTAHALTSVCAEAVGAMDAAVALTRDYINNRRQFGVTLNSFQVLQHRMADMLVETELSRSILYQGLASMTGPPAARPRAIAAMKAVVSSAALFVGRNAVQLHGGVGMTDEYAIGHFYRRLFVIAGQFGGETLHLRRMAAVGGQFWMDHESDRSSRGTVT
jgi:alkylation response protein AidB-like acyl-CoA dehydrogenase